MKLTNYRKNGEKFQNLLSMKPIFDADGIYRYVIGVQFEIIEDENLKQRLIQLDKLLRLLPSKLPGLRSKAKARAKGNLAARVDGKANELILKKDQVMGFEKQYVQAETISNPNGPTLIEADEEESESTVPTDFTQTVYHFTRIMWMHEPLESLRGIFGDQFGAECIIQFISCASTELVKHHALFCIDAIFISKAETPEERDQLLYKLHRQRNKNHLFYTTTNEIEYGRLPYTDWGAIWDEMEHRLELSLQLLSKQLMPKFMHSKWSVLLVEHLDKKGGSMEDPTTAKVASTGLNHKADSFWMDMFKRVADSVDCGIVIADMTIPGIPLNYVNQGFQNITGYGKEKIGANCRFLQGPETEVYLNDEIVEALRNAEPFCVKLHNYKKNGVKFQNLLCLQPIMGSNDSYKYQVGVNTEMRRGGGATAASELAEMDRFLKYMPYSLTSSDPRDLNRMPVDYTGDETQWLRMPTVDP